jgi:hypothetical protein
MVPVTEEEVVWCYRSILEAAALVRTSPVLLG